MRLSMLFLLVGLVALSGCFEGAICGDGEVSTGEQCEPYPNFGSVESYCGEYASCTHDCRCTDSFESSRAFWSTAEIAITSFSASPDGVILTLENNRPGTITLNSLSLNGAVVANGVPNIYSGDGATITSPAVTCTGGMYSYSVSIEYTDIETGATYIYTGDGVPLEGICEV